MLETFKLANLYDCTMLRVKINILKNNYVLFRGATQLIRANQVQVWPATVKRVDFLV